jgi:hypothetical protein
MARAHTCQLDAPCHAGFVGRTGEVEVWCGTVSIYLSPSEAADLARQIAVALMAETLAPHQLAEGGQTSERC